VPHVAATGPEPPGGAPAGAWIAAALAALTAVSLAPLVRARWRSHLVSAAIAEMPGFAGAPAPARTPQALVTRAFDSLSKGDVAAAAALMHPDVRWPDLGRGTLEGRSEFEDYWAERLVHVRVETHPVRFERRNGELVAEVNEVVRGRDYGTTVGEYHAVRRFTFREGLIAEMRRGRG
jgi:ketosteroid isomerase-like protein